MNYFDSNEWTRSKICDSSRPGDSIIHDEDAIGCFKDS
jgi:hypothetical protein